MLISKTPQQFHKCGFVLKGFFNYSYTWYCAPNLRNKFGTRSILVFPTPYTTMFHSSRGSRTLASKRRRSEVPHRNQEEKHNRMLVSITHSAISSLIHHASTSASRSITPRSLPSECKALRIWTGSSPSDACLKSISRRRACAI